ncbi:MAG: RNA pseudouridine synthase [Verrucomicrobiota bacterium]|nr:RNA pseudouridine synthase [Verrucomicrobiota bacterium]
MQEVFYLDNHLLVACKPAGLLTQPDETGNPSFQEELKAFLKGKGERWFLEPIHRLDRPASGLVLFARSSKALSRLQAQMREGKIERLYVAEIEGALFPEEGKLEHFLTHESHRARVVSRDVPGAKRASLTYQVFGRTERSTFVRVFLETGRYHQIRAQMSAAGHSIIGDGRYGAKCPAKTIHLHCARIAFYHPVTKEIVAVESAAPFSPQSAQH